MENGEMMSGSGMWLFGISAVLILILTILATAALVKYLMKK